MNPQWLELQASYLESLMVRVFMVGIARDGGGGGVQPGPGQPDRQAFLAFQLHNLSAAMKASELKEQLSRTADMLLSHSQTAR
jgi:hypothetical protein